MATGAGEQGCYSIRSQRDGFRHNRDICRYTTDESVGLNVRYLDSEGIAAPNKATLLNVCLASSVKSAADVINMLEQKHAGNLFRIRGASARHCKRRTAG